MLTLVDENDSERDVIVHASPSTLVSSLAQLLGTRELYAGPCALPAARTLADASLRDGGRVGLGRPVEQPAEERSGSDEPAILLTPGENGSGVIVHRPPRPTPPLPAPRDTTFTLPELPGLGPRTLQWVSALIVALSGGLGWLLPVALHDVALVAVPVAIAVAGLGLNLWDEARDDRRTELFEQMRDGAYRAAEAEGELMRTAYPGQETVAVIAARPGPRLWERRHADPDYLRLRVGVVDMPSTIVLTHQNPPPESTRPTLKDVPAVVSLTDTGVVGITGTEEAARALGRWLIAQTAVLHSPETVRMFLLTGAEQRDDWEWLRWLPHCRPEEGQDAIALIGNDDATVAARIAELLVLIETRRDMDPSELSSVVVVFDGWERFRSIHGAASILRRGPRAGVYSICLENDERRLPPDCDTVIAVTREELHVTQPEIDGGPPDQVSSQWCEQLARRLAPLRDADAADKPSLPAPSRLLDLLGMRSPTAEVVIQNWNSRHTAATAFIGESANGPLAIDLRRDGPNVLIAGETGAGKTDALCTLIASLAASQRPETMSFLLVEYRAAGVFGECTRLPHTVGTISDLDPHLASRMLAALNSELVRRERLLRAASATDIDDYPTVLGTDKEPLARLLIVVDELAALGRDLPEFVEGLVSVAQRGRSMGIHLVLATSRPGDVLTPSLRANSELRIALRLASTADSEDVIDTPAAAHLPRSIPGRGYLRRASGWDLGPVQVQLASVSGRPLETAVPWLVPAGWPDLGQPEPEPPMLPGELRERGADLAVLVRGIQRAAQKLRVSPPHRPVPPPLPGTLFLSGLQPDDRPGELRPVVYGLQDLPREHAQRPAVIDFATFGHLLAAGPTHSGRSQFLRTIAGSIAATHSCADVHLFGIDCADGALRAVADLPHCGAVVTTAQTERAARLVRRLGEELGRREELLSETRVRSIADQRLKASTARRLPHIVVLLNRWERFTETLGELRGGLTADTILRILRLGGPLGMHLIITADRDPITSRIAALSWEKLAFGLADREHGVPRFTPPGRAIHLDDSRTELQVALLDGDSTPDGQAAALGELARVTRIRDADVELARRPFRLDFEALVADRFHVGDAQGKPVGREDVLNWLRARHSAGSCAALLGPRRAGKTWVLKELERRLADDGWRDVRSVVVQLPSTRVDTPDELARILDRRMRRSRFPAEKLADEARARQGTPQRLNYLLDEVGRLTAYGPAAVSWLRDLGQSGAWIMYTGTEKDWSVVVRRALRAPGSSFGNDVDPQVLEPLDVRDAVTFLTGTAANLRVNLSETVATEIIALIGSWPFYLQVAGDAVVRAVQTDDLRPLRDTGALRHLIESQLLDKWTRHFQGRWAEIDAAGRAALLADPGHPPEALTPAQRDDLRAVGLLRPGNRWLDDQPFFDWIARNASVLRDGERP